MIRYIEKGIGMHEALSNAGLSLWQQDGEWVTNDDPLVIQAFIDNYVISKDELLAPINQRVEELIASVRAGIPDSEVASWVKQEAEARAGGGPLTTELAKARGVPLNVLLEKIIAKADAYAAFSGRVIGIRQSIEDKIDNGAVDVEWPI